MRPAAHGAPPLRAQGQPDPRRPHEAPLIWIEKTTQLGATGFLLATAKVEEAENIGYFGTAYRAYMKRTKMFIPFFF